MFIIDDMLKFPFTGFMFIVKEIANAADQERAQVRSDVMTRLTELHRSLEQGDIDDAEFDEQETLLLDQLDQLDAQ